MIPDAFADSCAEWFDTRQRRSAQLTTDDPDWYIAAHDAAQEVQVRSCLPPEYVDLPSGPYPLAVFHTRLAAQRSSLAARPAVLNPLHHQLLRGEQITLHALEQRAAIRHPWLGFRGIWCSADLLLPVGSKGWKIVRVLPNGKLRPGIISQTALFYAAIRNAGAEHIEIEFWYLDPTLQYGEPWRFRQKPGARLVHAKLVELEPLIGDFLQMINPGTGDYLIEAGQVSDAASEAGSGEAASSQADTSEAGTSQADNHDAPSLSHVQYLLRGKLDKRRLVAQGITDIRTIPADTRMSQRQRHQRTALISGEPVSDPVSLRTWLAAIPEPILFLDFESIQSSLPLFPHTVPWQYIPVMYSLTDASGHDSWECIAPGSGQLERLARSLARQLASAAAVGVFGAAMEQRCLQLLARIAADPADSTILKQAAGRLVDLHTPFESGWLYFAPQRGKTSLKALVPIITDEQDKTEGISDGREASLQYYWQHAGYPDGTWPVRLRQREVMAQIERYSRDDTRNLHRLWRFLHCHAGD
ncbi:DUF2779 domain-containing protein [Spirochaeta africana]|uniref:DUF2779 domain-containing protein n=1 Tax=Spirochaeta africana (strain ATCC 700263 / DSM 8902 / Z-7692) TaxID=889378 RepID=H9UI99_SPIAZ|nr:DUF2779 domain-containing protein [Spirochaeta africana]AFG37242.1 protein of unknown function(DUF2779) [Spirochaeta africana DSM 8902]